MEVEAINQFAQLGVAGVMGLLWLMERRYSSQRERQLTEAHTQLTRDREQLSELITVVKDNSVAMTALERSQAGLARVCEQIAQQLQSGSRDGRS